ncbi:MAG TPA: SCO1664 family protein [Jatrophihabitans sp.]|uniref:SCO1664 family protein n=1 Tax=Jatrophihabitans sp. TaxID=1932789 RepID=UPI002E0A1D86|nr:SCO1664 family protein [Jatrophihabitans sp.]
MTAPEELTPPLALSVDGGDGISVEDAVTLLSAGELSIEGRVVDASNATFYCGVELDGRQAACVYKPVAGERPLWDFPDGTLAEREVAAYEVSAATGWLIVPPTVYREGPAGPGMVQLWVETDDEVDIARFMRRRDLERLRFISVFDAVVNNADRKGGHLLPTRAGHVYGVDHGVTFSVEDKLRTVLWQWAGAKLPGPVRDTLRRLLDTFDDDLGERLGELLTRREVWRTKSRIEALLSTGRHPEPGGDWPPVPWPPI